MVSLRDSAPTASTRKIAIREQRRGLPIASAEAKLVEEIRKNETLIIIGETGSGKTTQLPQFLHLAGYCRQGKMVGITQPRRVAAVTVATRVAEEMGVQVGNEVGYSIRFEDATSPATRLKYMTDGMLLRETLLDPLLKKYSVIIIDEAHERTLHTDMLLGLLKGVQARRSNSGDSWGSRNGKANGNGESHMSPNLIKSLENMKDNVNFRSLKDGFHGGHLRPLKLIVMSATLDSTSFSEYFNGAKVVYIQGRQYPVQILNTYSPENDYLDAALITALQIHTEEASGDILVFLTGQEEIESLERLLHEREPLLPAECQKILVRPIYAALPSEQQMLAFEPAPDGTRKVILATNIAETSLTIPGIRYVVDPGVVKARAYNPQIGVESLAVVPVSKSQAAQRSGRAGREGPGKCFRLYTAHSFQTLEDTTVPEIKRCNLASAVLQMKALGIHDILGFDFMDKPSKAAIVKSLEHLLTLGALTDEAKISDVGKQMARFPLEPLYARAVLLSVGFQCSEEMVTVVAMLSAESIFFTPREKQKEANAARQRFISSEGDHITLLNVMRSYGLDTVSNEVAGIATDRNKQDKKMRSWCSQHFVNGRSMRRSLDIRRQIRDHVEGMGLQLTSCGEDMTVFRRCLTASFFLNAASQQLDGTYRVLGTGQEVSIHPSSVMFGKKPHCVIFNELVRTTRQYIRSITCIDSLWLPELAPHHFTARNADMASGTNSSMS